MLQRAMIAMAIACEPAAPDRRRADDGARRHDPGADPRSAEGAAAQAHGMAIVLITHDLGVVARMADEVAVMYAGEIVEHGSADDVFYGAAHPYTVGLRAAMPSKRHGERSGLRPIEGAPPDLFAPPRGLRVLRALPVCDGALREPAIRRRSPCRRGIARAAGCITSDAPPRAPAATAEATQCAPSRSKRAALTKHFPLGARPDRARRRRRVARDRTSARSSASSARAAPASRRSAARWSACIAKTAGDVLFRGDALPTKYSPDDFRRYAARHPDDLSGSVLELESAHDGRRDHRRRAAAARRPRDAAKVREAVGDWLARVGLERGHASRYPHEFSGGQRQRIGIARALIMRAEVRRLRRADLGARRVGAGADRATCSTS